MSKEDALAWSALGSTTVSAKSTPSSQAFPAPLTPGPRPAEDVTTNTGQRSSTVTTDNTNVRSTILETEALSLRAGDVLCRAVGTIRAIIVNDNNGA